MLHWINWSTIFFGLLLATAVCYDCSGKNVAGMLWCAIFYSYGRAQSAYFFFAVLFGNADFCAF